MISAVHTVIFSKDAEADRKFFKEVLKFDHVDVGGGWLIFALPPTELAVHPDQAGNKHEIYLMCESIEQFISQMQSSGVECSDIQDEGWGLLTAITLPGGSELGVYEPKHEVPG